MNRKGITLIELVIFILVGGIFVPLAYIAFMSVVKDSVKPETAATLKTVAEAKMVDIASMGFDSPQQNSDYPDYQDVRGDSSNTGGRFSNLSYAGYQWKWTYEYIVYQDQGNGSHGTTTITNNPPLVNSSSSFKVGDYVCPDSTCTNFYRAHFLKWAKNTLYSIYDFVVPTSSTYNYPFQTVSGGTSATSEPTNPTNWSADTVDATREDGGVTWQLNGTMDVSDWTSNTPYVIGTEVNPPSNTDRYTCTTAGTSGSSAPSSWGTTVYDGLRWKATSVDPTITLASTPPALPWTLDEVGTHSVDGNRIRWIKSNVYKKITVYVRPPNCTTTDCEYRVSTIVTSRIAP